MPGWLDVECLVLQQPRAFCLSLLQVHSWMLAQQCPHGGVSVHQSVYLHGTKPCLMCMCLVVMVQRQLCIDMQPCTVPLCGSAMP